MSNFSQSYKLFEVLKSGQPVSVEKIAQELEVNENSVPVYIHGLKKRGGEVLSIREDRKVAAYQLTNASEIDVAVFSRGGAVKALRSTVKKATKKVSPPAILVDEEDDVPPVTQAISDEELRDLKSQFEQAAAPDRSFDLV
jgi:biotin operon repressor